MSQSSRVLLIDDKPRIRSFVGRGLSAEGFGVDVAASGPEGLCRALDLFYDLVILDLLMPGMDGFTVLRSLLAHKPSQAVLVLSCLDDAATKVTCLGPGCGRLPRQAVLVRGTAGQSPGAAAPQGASRPGQQPWGQPRGTGGGSAGRAPQP